MFQIKSIVNKKKTLIYKNKKKQICNRIVKKICSDWKLLYRNKAALYQQKRENG